MHVAIDGPHRKRESQRSARGSTSSPGAAARIMPLSAWMRSSSCS